MHRGEVWQVFGANGAPITGRGTREDEVAGNAGVGIAQLWLWRHSATGALELLLQKRSEDKKRYPGYYGSSAGGHVNLGETFLVALQREAREEIGVEIDPERARFVALLRVPSEPQSLRAVYLYEAPQSWQPRFSDGEVTAVEWVAIDQFETMVAEPATYKLIEYGTAYLTMLTTALQQL